MDYLKAFLVGGAICAILQVFIEKTRIKTPILLVSLVVIGTLLTAIKVYEPLVKFAGAGATTPLLGFGYALSKGVVKAVGEKGFLGIFTGGLTATSGAITAVLLLAYAISFLAVQKNDTN